ncbi:hypothetical protein FSARC_14147 [Fusarium sarcochroum]|uniref:Xylanolytic transcriptional activator regulatory domain-containing protein n=1 Tax=Fusarium sarcochroum TaxID=1208366 RepID=A0A8H4SVM3_9HYPO|nr:hypothetical protein FSARC_14147 [Fusarium sarcochroum]
MTQAPSLESRLVRIEKLLQAAPDNKTGSCEDKAVPTKTANLDQPASLGSGKPRPSDLLTQKSSLETFKNKTRPLWKPYTEIPVLRLTESRVSELKQSISKESSWQQVIIPMLAKPEALLLVESYLDAVNPLVPLFDRNSLLDLCQNHFPVDSGTWDPAWWACLNAIIAISIQMNTISSDFVSVGRFSWSFFKNAFAVYGDLMLSDPTIISVKAMLTMAMFLSGTTDNNTMMLLLSSAGKRCQILGLDCEGLDSSLQPSNPTVNADKRRTYWVAYLVEKTFSMNCGFHSALPENIVEPQVSQNFRSMADDLAEPVDTGNWSFFESRVQLAIIESKTREYLRNPITNRKNMMDEGLPLKQELEDWRQSLPLNVRPEYNPVPRSEPIQLSAVMLSCAFYRSLDAINRAYHISMVRQSRIESVSIVSQSSSVGLLGGPRATIRLICQVEDICYTDLW